MKRLSVLLVAALGMSLVFQGGPARADSSLGIYNWEAFVDILVDEPHNRVYVTDDDEIYSFNLNGGAAGNNYMMTGPRQLTMTPDGAHVLVTTRHGILLLDPATLAVVETISVTSTPCPDAVAVASGLVFFTYGDCEGSTPGLAALDLATEEITTGLSTGVPPTDAQLASVPAAPAVLAASFGGTVVVLDTAAGETPSSTVRGSTAYLGAVDIALTPDGGSVLVANGSAEQKAFATADLAPLTGRTGTAATRAVGVRVDGMVGIGRQGVDQTDLAFIPNGATSPVRSVETGTGRYPAPRGLAFGTERAFVVTTNSSGANPRFHMIFAAPPTQLAVTTDKKFYDHNTTVTMAVRVVGGGGTGIVNVYQKQAGLQERLLKRGYLDPVSGKLTAKLKVAYNTTFRVEYEGDENHAPAKATKVAPVRERLALSSRFNSMSGPYHKVPSTADPLIHGESLPALYHGCVRIELHVRRADGSWRGVGSISCLETTLSGTFAVRLAAMKAGTRVRFTAKYLGGTKNAASLPVYYYLLYT